MRRQKGDAGAVVRFYALTNILKTKLKQRSIYWNVTAERKESIAEHVFGSCILAISIYSEFRPKKVNIDRILTMLLIHELEKIIVDDLATFDNISDKEKKDMDKKAVDDILDGLIEKEKYTKLIDEFNERKTNDAIYAYLCDKLEFDIQMFLYDSQGLVKLNKDFDSPVHKNPYIEQIIELGITKVSDVFYIYSSNKYKYNNEFYDIFVRAHITNFKSLFKKYLKK